MENSGFSRESTFMIDLYPNSWKGMLTVGGDGIAGIEECTTTYSMRKFMHIPVLRGEMERMGKRQERRNKHRV